MEESFQDRMRSNGDPSKNPVRNLNEVTNWGRLSLS